MNNKLNRLATFAVLALLSTLNSQLSTAFAGTHVWSGAVNGYWNVAGNWSSGGVPVVGEADLVVRFPSSPSLYQSTNNITGLSVQRFEMAGNGYHIYGNGVTLVTAPTGTNFTMSAGIGAFLHLPLSLPTRAYGVFVDLNGTLVLSSPISGAGGLDKHGRGLLRLNGSSGNTFAGGFRQRQGKVALGKTSGVALAGPVLLEPSVSGDDIDMTHEADHQIADTAAIFIRGGDTRLLMEGYEDTVGPIDFVGGAVITYRSGFSNERGLLQLNGNVTADNATSGYHREPEIVGRMSLGNAQRTITVPTTQRLIVSANVESTGPNGGITLDGGNLQFAYSNSFAGPLRIRAASEVYAYDSHAFGATNGPTILEGGQLFLGYGCFASGETLEVREGTYLTVAATNAWNGPIFIHTNQTLNVWSSSFGGYDWLTLGGAISGPGKMTYFINRVEFTGTQPNTLSGGHFFRWKTFAVLNKATSNSLTGPITLDYGFTAPAFPRILWNNHQQVGDSSSISWQDYAPEGTVKGELDLSGFSETIGSIQGNSWMRIDCSFGKLTVGGDGSDSRYTGSITGTGSGGTNLLKIGTGTFVLGTEFLGTAHSLAGKTVVQAGTLILDSANGVGAVHVANNARLAGNGNFNAITAGPNGVITPGLLLTPQSYGSMRPTAFAPGGGILGMELAGPIPGSSHDTLLVANGANLTGVLLQLSALNLPHGSNSFTLMYVGGSTPATGTFTGMPEGTVFPSSDGKLFRITYHGGDGNDVAVTRHYTGPIGGQISGVNRLPDGRIQINGTGLPGLSYRVHATTNFAPGSWIDIGSADADPDFSTIEFIDPNAAQHPHRFYRFMIQ